ncbi:FG-GAP-like repeat-containing protein [Luteirhabdus pelagi]|uniref:FG-GAP-like repeat-containing protein n=1 Tax=Luteirhabdus pelagi TaxID=2792783 RepID=UPI001939D293|nr:FG-GAP-like repeat-containing protein [Luteirhabdus pelagi]
MRTSLFFIFIPLLSLAQVSFQENAVALGCDNTTYGDGEYGGGISFFDFDNDGWDDITLASQETYPVRFFKNNNGQFTEVDLGIVNTSELKTVQWVDFDNDGDNDFFATSNVDSNHLFENDGNMNFTDITESAGLLVSGHISYGASWGDIDNDGDLDMYLCSRNGDLTSEGNYLYRNNGNATFTNITVAAGMPTENNMSFCAAFMDYDKDGYQDIYVANDKDPVNLMFHNNGDGTFTEVGALTNTNIMMDDMSTAVEDFNYDGLLDIYVTNTNDGNVFLRNTEDFIFEDVAATNGTLMESWAWGSVFVDAENDGDLDLYVSGEYDDATNNLPSAFYENDGDGMFTIPSGIGFEDDLAESYSNAMGDVNNDGYPELVVLNYFPYNMFIWDNTSTQSNNWLKVKLQGVESNRMGIGSWIEVGVGSRVQYRYTLCGEGFLGQNSAYEFFGIGAAAEIDYIKVTWLSGTVDFIENPPINSQTLIVEGSNELSVTQTAQVSPLKIYPNPSTDSFTVSVAEEYTYVVFDSTGKQLLDGVLKEGRKQIDLSVFKQGIYFLQLSNGSETFAHKLVKQ